MGAAAPPADLGNVVRTERGMKRQGRTQLDTLHGSSREPAPSHPEYTNLKTFGQQRIRKSILLLPHVRGTWPSDA